MNLETLTSTARVDQELHARFPSLARAEFQTETATRAVERREILELIPYGAVGVELGVFAGAFSRELLAVTRPRILHLVDPWWTVFGETYPNWGGYTDNGHLETRVAHEAACIRSDASRGDAEVRVHVNSANAWLESLPDAHLDWAYLDTTHTYEDTISELTLLARKVKPAGLILGDDYWIEPGNVHYGVIQAVHAFLRQEPYQLVRADRNQQFALRREPIL